MEEKSATGKEYVKAQTNKDFSFVPLRCEGRLHITIFSCSLYIT